MVRGSKAPARKREKHMATRTPWGMSDYREELAPGIIWYGTPSHGGCHLDPCANSKIHDAWRRADGWYEEDCDWAIVAFHFPQAFLKDYRQAIDTLRNWHPKAYMQVTGVELRPDESYMLRKESQGFRDWLTQKH